MPASLPFCKVSARSPLLTIGFPSIGYDPLQWMPFAADRHGRAHPGPDMTDTGESASDAQLARVLDSFRPDLLRFAFWLARDRSVAEDVVQETMLRAWRARSDLQKATSLRAWLLTIARREHARLHERKRHPEINLDEAVERQDEALALHDSDPDIEDLRRAILSLPDEYREPLVMQVLGGFSAGEIAAELKLSVPAVLTRLFRARNKLRERYGVAVGGAPMPAEDAP